MTILQHSQRQLIMKILELVKKAT